MPRCLLMRSLTKSLTVPTCSALDCFGLCQSGHDYVADWGEKDSTTTTTTMMMLMLSAIA
jgi:hypothetical protein